MSFKLPELVLPTGVTKIQNPKPPQVQLALPAKTKTNYWIYIYVAILVVGFVFLLQRTIFISNSGVRSLTAGTGIELTGDSHDVTISLADVALPIVVATLGSHDTDVTVSVASPNNMTMTFTWPSVGTYIISYSGYVYPDVNPTDASLDYVNISYNPLNGIGGVAVPCGALKCTHQQPAYFSYSGLVVVTSAFAGTTGGLAAYLVNGTATWNVVVNGQGPSDYSKVYFVKIA